MHRYHKILRDWDEEFEKQWESWSDDQREAFRKHIEQQNKEIEDNWLGMLLPSKLEEKVLTPEIWEKWFEKEIPVQ